MSMHLMFLFPLLVCGVSLAAATAEDSATTVALGGQVYAEHCNRCHELVFPASRDGRAWRAISLHMRVFANISKDEQHQVFIFLREQSLAAASDQVLRKPVAGSEK